MSSVESVPPVVGRGPGLRVLRKVRVGNRTFALLRATRRCPVRLGQRVPGKLKDDPAGFTNVPVRPMPGWKRAMDLLGSAIGIVLLLPVMGLIALGIKATSPGPVLFRQKRAGIGGVPFVMYKFRTMVADAEARKKQLLAFNEQDGPAFKMADDPRLTRFGRFLRRTSLDELPQLWNVLLGQMSLVGPRPLPCEEAEACAPWQRQRLQVTPGITCFWQVRGRSSVSFDQWVRMDLEYIQRRSLLTDLKILLQTIPAVLSGRGAC